MDCMSCREPILTESERAPRYYRIKKTGYVFTQYHHDTCHWKRLAEKPGIEESDVPPDPRASMRPDSQISVQRDGITVRVNHSARITLPRTEHAMRQVQKLLARKKPASLPKLIQNRMKVPVIP
jgi:hypothetical protein